MDTPNERRQNWWSRFKPVWPSRLKGSILDELRPRPNQESTSAYQEKLRFKKDQEKICDLKLPEWVVTLLAESLEQQGFHIDLDESPTQYYDDLYWKYNVIRYDVRICPLLCIRKQVWDEIDHREIAFILSGFGTCIDGESNIKIAGAHDPAKTVFVCLEDYQEPLPKPYINALGQWARLEREPKLKGGFLPWQRLKALKETVTAEEKSKILLKDLDLEELRTPAIMSPRKAKGEDIMDCFTQEQFVMARNGLHRSFRTWLSFANMLTEVANTPKVQQYPNSHIAEILKDLEPHAPAVAGVTAAINLILQEIRNNNLCRELVKTAHEWNPYDVDLDALNRQFMQIKTVEPEQENELERLLNITIKEFLNPLTFAKRLGPIRYRVCRIEIGAKDGLDRLPCATGFLVGPDLVLTNHHVIADVLEGKLNANQFAFGFDRVEWEDGTRTSGPTYGLNTPSQRSEWLLAMSETDALDYALLRLDTRAGELPILSNTTNEQAAKRGWLALSEDGSRALKKGTQFIIFQHPAGLPLRLDIREVGEVSETQVTYTTNTMKGSSGSPCFDGEFRLCALHHAGPNGALNQGIRVGAILADLEKKKLKDKVCIESPEM